MLLQQRHTTHTYAIIHSFSTMYLGPWITFRITKQDLKTIKKFLFFVLLLQFNYCDLKHMERINFMKQRAWNNGNAVARFSLRLIKEPSFAANPLWAKNNVIQAYILKWVMRHLSFMSILHINLLKNCFPFRLFVDWIIRQFIFIELPVFNPNCCKGLTLLRAKSIHPFINWTQFCTKWH